MRWVTPREAYALYAAEVEEPVRFDSFRRWITEGRVLSCKAGLRNTVSASSAKAWGRLQARSLESYLSDRLGPVLDLPEESPAIILVDVVPEDELDFHGTLFLAHGDVDALRSALVEQLEANPEAKTVKFEYEGRSFTCTARGRIIVCMWSTAMQRERLVKWGNAVESALLERLLDDLVRRGILDYGEDSRGESTFRRLEAEVGLGPLDT
jgi:hypothetical protein